MKLIILLFSCITLTATAGLTEHVHLVGTWPNGDLVDPATGKPPTRPAFVLLLPIHESNGTVVINPVVFTTFDVKAIGLVLKGAVKNGTLAPGTILDLDNAQTMKEPPKEQIKALHDYCIEIGISFGVSATA